MALWKATIELLVEADNWGEVSDAITETLRPVTGQGYAFLDWQYAPGDNPLPTTGEEFIEYWEYRNEAQLGLARDAIARMKARDGEHIETWADRLATDLGAFKD